MRIFKHALLSLLRKPTKAIMIFCILVLVFGLVFTGIIIQKSLKESKDFVRIQLGATVQYVPDYNKAMIDELPYEDYTQLVLSASVADTIKQDSRVKEAYLVKNGYGLAKEVKSGNNYGEDVNVKVESSAEGGTIDGMENYPVETYLNIFGINTEKSIEFDNESLKLTSGTFFSKSQLDNGEDVCIISAELATANGFSLGDMLKITNMINYESAPIEIQIIGIYEGAKMGMADTIFTPLLTTEQFMYPEEVENITSIYFLLTDPLDVPGFIADNSNKLPSIYTKLTANDSEYKQLTKPLDLMEIITSILIWVIFGAGALIVLSIVTIFVRDRKFEIGLLLASGESKIRIIDQFILELLIISIIAFSVSAGVSQVTARFVSQWIVENQLVENTDEPVGYYDVYSWGPGETKGTVDMESIAKDFNVSIEFSLFVNLLLISFGILLFAASIPLIVIMSYKPREALQD